MVMLSALDLKLWRDLKRLWAQALAVALVMACGVMTFVIAGGALRSLEETQAAFYDRYRFGSVFATVTRAPVSLGTKVERISGVSSVEMRIVRSVVLDIDGMAEPAAGLVVSLPAEGEPAVNRLYLRKGRMPQAGRINETAVLESFADAHNLHPGDGVKAIMNGHVRTLKITGIVLSPEYVYAIGPGDMVPDQRRFGVFFMPRPVLEGLYDMEQAFNDISLTVLRNTDSGRIVKFIDKLLKPYGSTGAYERDEQLSHAFLDAELTSLEAMAKVIPPVFLFVSAFLVNMILSRLIALEREQIGLLKAVGYSGSAVGWHYARLVIVIAIIGVIAGSVAGFWLGRGLTRLYADFFFFPFLVFRNSLDLYLMAAVITVFAALAGSVRAVFAVMKLSPAVAMLPPAPPVYRSWFASHRKHRSLRSGLTIMSLRHLLRWPIRSAMTTLGVSLSVSLLIAALFTFDSIDNMVETIFYRAERQDLTLGFPQALSPEALDGVRQLPGVLKAEPFRTSMVKIVNGHREKKLALNGIDAGTELSLLLDPQKHPMQPLPAGLFLSERVASELELRVGDRVLLVLMEKHNRTLEVPLTGLTESYMGLGAYMSLSAMNRVMGDGDRVSGARLRVDSAQLGELYDEIKQTPALSSIAIQRISRQRFRETIEENITTMTSVYVILAVVITFGVIYNSARIQLSERARELASLRVFGFTRAEVSGVLLTELALIVLIAQPVGWGIGWLFAWSVVQGFSSDLYRLPLVVDTATYAVSSLVVLLAALGSALIVRRRVDSLDLVAVLKSRE